METKENTPDLLKKVLPKIVEILDYLVEEIHSNKQWAEDDYDHWDPAYDEIRDVLNDVKHTVRKSILLTTAELLEEVKRKATAGRESQCVEASLCLVGGCRATHYLTYDPDTGVLYDTGIDDEEYETTLEEFANDSLYGRPEARWQLWDN